MRENIVEAISRAEKVVVATRHGPYLLKRLGVTQFNQEPEQWRNRAKVGHERKFNPLLLSVLEPALTL